MKTFLNFRNSLTMLYKNLPDDELKGVMRMRCFLDWLAAFEMLILQHNIGDFKAVIRGRRAFHKWKHEFDKDRKEIAATRTLNPVPERLNISILWEYYLRGKKKWAALSPPSPHPGGGLITSKR